MAAANVAFADGGTQLFVGGEFSGVDDVAGPNGERWGAAKFNATDGSLDPNFTTSARVGYKIEPNSFLRQADGFTLISFARFQLIHYPPISHAFGRLFSTGELDLTFDPIATFDPNRPLGPNFVSTGFTPFSDGTLLVTGENGVSANYGRLLRDGGTGHLTDVYVGSGVLALTATQTDPNPNAVLFGYLSMDGSYHLVRLSPDGSKDLSFQGQTFPVSMSFIRTQVTDGVNGNVFVNMWFPDDIPLKQAKNVLDNKVVLMGSFASYGGVPPEPAHGMMRIKPDGSFDPDFSVGDGARWVVTPETEFRHPSVDNLEVGLNDKLLLTGTFEAFYNKKTLAPGIINLNPDGTIDPQFVAPVNREIYDYSTAYLKRQPDGSFLLSGPYSAGNGPSPSFFRLLLPPGVPTPQGTDVTVDLGGSGGAEDVTVNFNTVETGGTTSLEQIEPQWAGDLPRGYRIVGPDLAFEIYTTATYTPPVTVCFDLSSLNAHTFAAARILHNDGSGLVDVTSSKDPVTQTICAEVNSLSPFAVAVPAATPRPRPTPHPRPR